MDESRIIYPCEILSQYIKYYWILKREDHGSFNLQTIPSGCLHLVFHRQGRVNIVGSGKQPSCFIRGQFSKSGLLLSSGEMDMIAVLFKPMGMWSFFSVNMSELTDSYIDVEEIEDTGLNRLKDDINSEEDSLRCISLIESFFISRLSLKKDSYIYERLLPSVTSMVLDNSVAVEKLASDSCYSYRQYIRLFTSITGVNPKVYSRIVRFQHSLYLLQLKGNIQLDELAFECGYYDVSHLVKEFKLFSGYTPTQYMLTHNPYSSFFANGSELNIIKKMEE